MIEVINVKKDYVKGRLTTKALKGICFTLNDHGFISILGPIISFFFLNNKNEKIGTRTI